MYSAHGGGGGTASRNKNVHFKLAGKSCRIQIIIGLYLLILCMDIVFNKFGRIFAAKLSDKHRHRSSKDSIFLFCNLVVFIHRVTKKKRSVSSFVIFLLDLKVLATCNKYEIAAINI